MRVVAKLMDNGRRIGFVFDNGERLLDYDILIKMKNGYNFGLKYSGNRFRLTDGTRISDLQEIKYARNNVVKMKRRNVLSFTGSDLKSYIETSGISEYNGERDFVTQVVDYCNNWDKNRKRFVLGIAGLRGVGKTVGMLQAINRLNQYNDTLFITLDRDKVIDIEKIYDIIRDSKKRYVFIDEITSVLNLISGSCFLFDEFIMKGYKIIISGTDSYALYASLRDALHHRMIILPVTFISYKEFSKLMNINSLKSYIEMGGLCTSQSFENVQGLSDYVDTSVVSNIINTMSKNSITYKHVPNKDVITAGVMYILYSVILARVYNDKQVNFMLMVNIVDRRVPRSQVLEFLSNEFGFTLEKVNKSVINKLLIILKQIGLLVEVDNIGDCGGSKYYITNPAVVNQLYSSIYRALRFNRYSVDPSVMYNGRISFSQINGLVLESVIVSSVKAFIEHKNYSVYYYRDTQDREVDLVVLDERDVSYTGGIACYEIKLTNNVEKAYDKSRWLVNSDIYNYFGTDREVCGRAVIYGGISQESQGIKFINAVEFLLNIGGKLGEVLDVRLED